VIDKEKQIYKLPDGTRSYDPLSVRRRLLLGSKNKFNEWVTMYNDGLDELDRLAAEGMLVETARTAMELPPLTAPNGVSDKTVLEYIGHFLEWLSAPLSQSTPPKQIDTPCLDCPPAR
jgi:hypothetical protein